MRTGYVFCVTLVITVAAVLNLRQMVHITILGVWVCLSLVGFIGCRSDRFSVSATTVCVDI